MSDRQAPLGHHLDQVAVGELVAQVPAHAQDDDFLFEVSALEQIARHRLMGLCKMLLEAMVAIVMRQLNVTLAIVAPIGTTIGMVITCMDEDKTCFTDSAALGIP